MKIRKQSGCVVYRPSRGRSVEVLLVTSTNKGKWGFPKGGVEHNLTKKESAAKEVYEEAGVIGKITARLGEFTYNKEGRQQHVIMYAMRYKRKSPDWQEEGMRKRKWFTLNEARKVLSRRLRNFIDALENHLMDSEFMSTSSVNFRVDNSVGANTNNREFENVVRHLEEMPLLKDLAELQPVDIKVDGKSIRINSEDLNVRIIVSKANVHAKMLVIQYGYEGVSHTERVGLTKVNAVLNRVINQYFAHQNGTEGIGIGF